MNSHAERLDLLVHPFYTMSKILSSFKIDDISEKNILRLKELWLDSISTAAANPKCYFAIVNGVDLTDEALAAHEFANPFRGMYREIISHARQSLNGKMFYFFPVIRNGDIEVQQISENLRLARKDSSSFTYDWSNLIICAYGEHADADTQRRGGCVDSNLACLANALGVDINNVSVDRNKSLPLQPIIKISKPYAGFHVPESLYYTITQLEQLAQDPKYN